MAGREKLSVSFRISPATKRQVEQLTQVMGLSQTAVLETAIRHLAKAENVGDNGPMLSATALMRLPLKERRAALAAGARAVEPHYRDDLARLLDRELTAFTALDQEPILEDYIPES